MTTVYCLVASISLCLLLWAGFYLKNTLLVTYATRGPEAGFRRSLRFYAPMDRLLSENDFKFLQNRPEIKRASIERLRRDRRRIFRSYLGFLATDFAGINKEIRSLMMASPVSREDLAKTMVKARFLFTVAMLGLEFRLLLHACGIHNLQISVAPLTSNLEQMRNQLSLLSMNTPLWAEGF